MIKSTYVHICVAKINTSICTCIFGGVWFEFRHQEKSSDVNVCGTDPLRESVLCCEIFVSECIKAAKT